MFVHTIFDLLAWTSAFLSGRWVSRHLLAGIAQPRTPFSDPVYFIALALGALMGAILFGSLNLGLAGMLVPGHSIAGAIIGGIVTVEAFKWFSGVRGSTGLAFVAPLAVGIAVGRLGCFLAGLPDFTYGTPTSLPWGVDFGDGVRRHPVQIYESLSMLTFLAVYLREIVRGSDLFLRQGFYLFVGWYGVQRFAWEFLKPYPKVFGPFNIFHLLTLVMIAYGLLMMARNRELHPAR